MHMEIFVMCRLSLMQRDKKRALPISRGKCRTLGGLIVMYSCYSIEGGKSSETTKKTISGREKADCGSGS